MNFRNVIIALACMALFVGLAGAQQQQLATVNCTVSAATSPTIRSEGVTDKVGDVLITCGTSTTLATSGPVTRGNLLVDFGAPLTSKNSTSVNNVGAPSEILLLINDPMGAAGNGPVPGYGQNAVINVCTAEKLAADAANEISLGTLGNGSPIVSTATNCPAYLVAKTATASSQTFWELDSNSAGTGGSAANALQGAVGGKVNNKGLVGVSWTGNQVMFWNVPIFPSYNASQSNVFRIVNARVNPGANATISATLTPSVISGNNGPVVGSAFTYAMTGTAQVATVATGLTASVSGPVGVSLCNPTDLSPSGNIVKANLSLLTFKENFTGAFKTAYLPLTNLAGAAMSAQPQFTPSGNYSVLVGTNTVTLSDAYSEAGFTAAGDVGAVTGTGLANSGTRFKAKFASLDANTIYYISTNPVVDFQTRPTLPTVGAGDASALPWAQLLQTQGSAGETAAYAAANTNLATANGVVPVAKLIVGTDGTAEAVWEVTNTVEGSPQSMSFAVYAVYNTNLGTTPTAGNVATVQLGYAPTNGDGFSNPKGVTTSAIPRFVAPSMAATKFHNILPCQTSLLFPYVVGIAGYNTGLAIANTSADTFGTATSTGTCTLNFFSSATPVAYTSASVAPGTAYTALLNTTNMLSDAAGTTTLTGFSGIGYMFATCNFQYPHGFAFIDKGDGTPNAMAMGYVAQVMNGTNRALPLNGESLGN